MSKAPKSWNEMKRYTIDMKMVKRHIYRMLINLSCISLFRIEKSADIIQSPKMKQKLKAEEWMNM